MNSVIVTAINCDGQTAEYEVVYTVIIISCLYIIYTHILFLFTFIADNNC